MAKPTEPLERRVLVLAPTGRDGRLTAQLLGSEGFDVHVCSTHHDFLTEIERGLGMALLTEEALTRELIEGLHHAVEHQPPWSDIAWVLFARERSDDPFSLLGGLPNVTVLERPTRVKPLVSVVKSALRSRGRQYQLRELLDQLAEADRRKNEFLAMLGHELRNPLGAIRAALSVLSESDDIGHPATIIDRQTRSLTRMVDDLLEVSRVLSGKIILRRNRVDVVEHARLALAGVEEAVRDRSHELQLVAPGGPIVADADPLRIEQIVWNLVHNAVKYTPSGGHISVEIERVGESCVMRVRDDGVGLAPEDLESIFEPFTQTGATIDRGQGGLGLGLPLVRKLVELHGGTIVASSAGKNLGACFEVRLPALGRGARPDRATPIQDRAAMGSLEVLLVDDNLDLLDMWRVLLERQGHRVQTAPDGLQAVEKALAHRPDVAIIDIGLPGLNGYEVARQIKDGCQRAPFLVAVTGYGQAEDKQRALEAGFHRHLVKPVTPEVLDAVLGEL